MSWIGVPKYSFYLFYLVNASFEYIGIILKTLHCCNSLSNTIGNRKMKRHFHFGFHDISCVLYSFHLYVACTIVPCTMIRDIIINTSIIHVIRIDIKFHNFFFNEHINNGVDADC